MVSIVTITGTLDIIRKSSIFFTSRIFTNAKDSCRLLVEQRKINSIVENEVSCLYTFFRDAINAVIF